MGNLIRRIGRSLFLVFSTLSVVACFKPTAPPSFEFRPFESPVSASRPQCPDLSGTYQLTPGSEESRLFSPYLLPPHQMDIVQLSRNSNDWFVYRLKMHKARFVDQVSALQASNPDAYAKWRELIPHWQQEKREHKDLSVMEGKILAIGPLPERSGLLTPTQCEAFWGMIQDRYGAPVGLREEVENVNTVDTETLLSRSKQGALLFRYDNYRTASSIFGSRIRTGIINSAYAKLEPMQDSLFDWEVTNETAPFSRVAVEQNFNPEAKLTGAQQTGQVAPNNVVTQRPANLPAMLVDVQQYAMGQLARGASIRYFVLDELSPNTALSISIKGEANSNKEVSDLLRAMMQHTQVENVELVSVQRSDKDKIEFEIRLVLKDQTK